MMSFWVVPWSTSAVDAVLLGGDDVEREQPRRRRVDRHRRVHLVERDAVEQRVHVALVRDGHADLADLAARELVVGVVAGLRRQVEGDASGPVWPLARLRRYSSLDFARGRMARVRAHHPRPVGLGQAVAHAARVWLSASPCAVAVPRHAADRRHHLGRERVICCWEVDGVLIDPGPQSSEERCSRRSAARRPRAIAAHAHPPRPRGRDGVARAALAGARRSTSTSAARRTWSTRRSSWASAGRLYGDDMDERWGEVVPVPEENMHARRRRRDGPRAARRLHARATPPTTSPTCTRTAAARSSATSAGVRIPPVDHTLMPTPPPDIDVEAWLDSIATVESWSPRGDRGHALRRPRGRRRARSTTRATSCAAGPRSPASSTRTRFRERFHADLAERIDDEADPRRDDPGERPAARVRRARALLAQARERPPPGLDSASHAARVRHCPVGAR